MMTHLATRVHDCKEFVLDWAAAKMAEEADVLVDENYLKRVPPYVKTKEHFGKGSSSIKEEIKAEEDEPSMPAHEVSPRGLETSNDEKEASP